MNKQQNTARAAGLMYLIIAITGGFGHFSLHETLLVPGDAAATVKNIQASELLYRWSFLSNLACQLCFIVLPLLLYRLLKDVSKNQAVLMVVLVFMGVPVACVNLVNQFAALLILNGPPYMKAFSPDQLNALVMLFLDIQKHGVFIAQVFWGLWLFPLGYLVYHSVFFPKVPGILLMIACFIYVAGSITTFLSPENEKLFEWFYLEPTVAEITFCFWLLIKGGRR